MSVLDNFVRLTKQFYPTGRAFKLAYDSWKLKLHNGLAKSEAEALAAADSIKDSILPDNDNFTAADATQWERRLGLITNDAVSLANRKLAILRKMNHPGTTLAQENYRFLEDQLQAAGFDVYVHENRFSDGMGGYITMTPEELTGDFSTVVQHNDIQHGDAQHGTGIWDKVVNNLDEDLDLDFNVGSNLKSTFFIGGPYAGDYADVDENRKEEFRQIILKVKPTQTVGYLFINYI